MDIRAAEISKVIRDQIASFGTEAQVSEVGEVLSVGDDIARIHGLDQVQAGEMVEFSNGVKGMALNLEADNVGVVIFGLGSALFEELHFADGQLTNPNLSDYNIASALDVASLRHRVMEMPGAEVHGLGETAVPPVPPAIGNAVASLGYDVHRLPMTPERVLAARPSRKEEQ